jgi:hypothetical protein
MTLLRGRITASIFWIVLLNALHTLDHACAESQRTQVTLATYRLENSKSSGTCFIIERPGSDADDAPELLLVTAAHAFQKMDGPRATIVLRHQDDADNWTARPTDFVIRKKDKPLWQQHAKHDVAVIRIPEDVNASSIPLSFLASDDDWKSGSLDPGSLIHTVGFPHAQQFKPSPAGFPLTRLGCVASYPLTPYEKHPTFLVDYNTFEGDSGGPVYAEFTDDGRPHLKVIGLVHGQHFLNERYKMVYQEGTIRKRLGMAIIVNSQAILETIEALDSAEQR